MNLMKIENKIYNTINYKKIEKPFAKDVNNYLNPQKIPM